MSGNTKKLDVKSMMTFLTIKIIFWFMCIFEYGMWFYVAVFFKRFGETLLWDVMQTTFRNIVNTIYHHKVLCFHNKNTMKDFRFYTILSNDASKV